jgi:hypothetical protein
MVAVGNVFLLGFRSAACFTAMGFESVGPPEGVGCSCLREAVADPAAPITFNVRMREFELRASSQMVALFYYCPFCGEPSPPSFRGSFFVEADARERARLDALTAGVNNEAAMRAKFGAPDWDHRSVTFTEFSANATVLAMFRDDKAGVVLMPKPNPAAQEPRRARVFDHINGRPAPALDEMGVRSTTCTCGNLAESVARRAAVIRFHEERFELHVPGWSRVVRHCWFCGGEAPKEVGVPRHLYPSAEEEARIKALSADMETPEDAARISGQAQRDRREFRYYELSPTAEVQWAIVDAKWTGPYYTSKYVGPKE